MKYCPRCKRLMPQGNTYCTECKPIVEKQIEERKIQNKAKYDKKYNQTKRNPLYAQFYKSKEWKTLRAVKLSQSDYICEECKAKGVISLAVDVHHIEPISKVWDKRLDINNLRCLCVKCHNAEHDRWRKQFTKRK